MLVCKAPFFCSLSVYFLTSYLCLFQSKEAQMTKTPPKRLHEKTLRAAPRTKVGFKSYVSYCM